MIGETSRAGCYRIFGGMDAGDGKVSGGLAVKFAPRLAYR